MWKNFESETNKVQALFLSGVATSPTFMEPFRIRMEGLLANNNVVATSLLFPYGDWDRKWWRQVMEVRHDLFLAEKQWHRSIGGNSVLNELLQYKNDKDVTTILIGHSGGGIAALHAAYLFTSHGLHAPLVVQIGSPKCHVPEVFRKRVLYIAGVNSRGRLSDSVTRLRGLRRQLSPETICLLPIQGGHRDYFRESARFTDLEGRSNLSKVTECVWNWVQSLSLS